MFVRGVENIRQFHADSRQIIDVEKPPVIDFLGRHSPESEAVGLSVQQFIQPIETARIPDVAVNRLDRFLNRPLHLWRFGATAFQTFLDNLLLARAFLDPFGIGLGPSWQVFQRGKDALEFGEKILIAKLRQILQRQGEDETVGAGRDWKNVIEITERKRATLKAHTKLASFQNPAILITENWQQHLIVQIG